MKLNFLGCLILSILTFLKSGQSLTVEEIESTFVNELNRTLIRENLQFLTRNPHMSGTIHNNRLADHLAELWEGYGFDSVEKVVYEVLLSYPDRHNPNKVQLLDEDGQVIFTSKYMETSLRPEDAHEDFIPMFNTFSPNGTAEGDLVYVNFARPEDYKALIDIGVNFTGKIVIARYGEIHRGNKVNLASQYGAVAVILFSDPYQYAQEGEGPNDVYPHSKWLPGSGVQRGSVITVSGDSQTPRYPSIPNVYRWKIKDLSLPKIPCQPIGYDDAKHLMSRLGGSIAPEQWRDHASTGFRVGPGFVDGNSTIKVRVSVHNQLTITNVTNVIGIIKGGVEPDRYVLAGNHRDSWGFGAVDASSGTAQMIEATRVFGKLLDRGWRPRRSIVFCSWDAEEFGLTGSYEWVEDNLLKLTHRAVAYVNTDICVEDVLFTPNASPFLSKFLIDVTKKVPSPANESFSLYDTWLEDSTRYGAIKSNGEIKVRYLSGGTDHVPFFAYAGVAAINIAFQVDQLKHRRPLSSYPAYHTAFDTFYLMDTFIDPEYRRMRACGQLNLFLLYRLAESNIIPFDMTGYRDSITEAVEALHRDGIWDLLHNNSVNLNHLEASIQRFIEETKTWELHMENFTSTDPLAIRALNDQLMQLDKSFLKSSGIPFQPQYRHMVMALSLHNMYGSSTFPGIRDLVHEISSHPIEDDPRWLQLQMHISDLIVAFHTATNILKSFHII